VQAVHLSRQIKIIFTTDYFQQEIHMKELQ
jgi:hypothetical protein